MKVSFIGAGRTGCSIGKYFSMRGVEVAGYYSRSEESARWAADFTGSEYFADISRCAEADVIFAAVPDDAVEEVWRALRAYKLMGKTVGHFSGVLTSEIFTNIRIKGAFGVSVHPMYAFDDKETAYKQLSEAGFTLEGDEKGIQIIRGLLESCGNPVMEMERKQKVKYHAAASMLSNQVAAVLAGGFALLEEAGFTPEQARTFSKTLIQKNVENVVKKGAVEALTGPVERNDVQTVYRHLQVMDQDKQNLYKLLGQRLLALAAQKNPDRDYSAMADLLK